MASVAVAPVEAEAVPVEAEAVLGPPDPAPSHEGKCLSGKVVISRDYEEPGDISPAPGIYLKRLEKCQYSEEMTTYFERAVEICLAYPGAGGITKSEEVSSRVDVHGEAIKLMVYRVWTGTELQDSSSGQVSWLRSDLEVVANAQAAYDASPKPKPKPKPMLQPKQQL